jgi:glyoxalase family protein
MLDQIKGLHHVTSMAANARDNNAFFTETLGLRRVKKTVNFDAPDVYHLYYGDEVGTPGSVMTYFPFPHIAKGKPGAGEVGATAFSIPKGSLGRWESRLGDAGVSGLSRDEAFGAERLHFAGPDGDGFALIEVDGDTRVPFLGAGVDADAAIRGFHSVQLRLRDGGATTELLTFMGYETVERSGAVTRMRVKGGGVADIIDIETLPGAPAARQGAGSVHHVAFAVENRETQLAVRQALLDTGHQVTPVIDRDYFWAIYFRTPGGVLFEIATNEPGFERDEDRSSLGQGLMLPTRYEPSRTAIAAHLPPL